MRNIIVSDVFGRTEALEGIASSFSGVTDIFEPYNAMNMDFGNEEEAYSYFTSEVGLNKYANNLKSFIQSFAEQLNLIGFSVGASAIWRISAQVKLENISSATCFYGSQIRNDRDICPIFPMELIFPIAEEHFSVSELISDLSDKENIQIQQVSFAHGFMNSHSINYHQGGYDQFICALQKAQNTSMSKGHIQ